GQLQGLGHGRGLAPGLLRDGSRQVAAAAPRSRGYALAQQLQAIAGIGAERAARGTLLGPALAERLHVLAEAAALLARRLHPAPKGYAAVRGKGGREQQ